MSDERSSGHSQDHDHGEPAGHDHSHAHVSVDPDDDHPLTLSRRRLLQALGAGTGAAVVLGPAGTEAAAAADLPSGRVLNAWVPGVHFLRGDHHIHTQYSSDAMNPVSRVVSKSAEYGLDWMVITDHGGVAHQKLSIDKVTPDIEAARKAHPGVLVYQGLEWNIPGAEHATVFLPPGRHTVDVLRAFEASFDGGVLSTPTSSGGLGKIKRSTSPDGEPYALEAIAYLDEQVRSGRVPVALMFANHPARRGLDSPHEFRNWRDAAPRVAVGMEGAPGHQAEGIPEAAGGMGGGRGAYDKAPDTNGDSFAGYAPNDTENPYRTYGGFDWLTAKVGGLWDSLLAEGKPWWVTSTSDSHQVHRDTFTQGKQDFATTGSVGAPLPSPAPVVRGDFWPGYYSATLVAAPHRRYVDVMRALQAGKVIAVHGRLVDGLDVRVRSLGRGDRRGATLGGRTFARRGDDVELSVTVALPGGPNHAGSVPRLAKIDVIAGPVTGAARDRDALTAPGTTVVKTLEVPSTARRSVSFRYLFKDVDGPFYLRLRGSDGKRLTSSGDPVQDVTGDADPWQDLWFYANPVFVDVV